MKPLRSLALLLPAALAFAACAPRPALRSAAAPPPARPEERAAAKPKKARSAAVVTAADLRKDGECAILHDSLRSVHERDASIREFAAKFGEAETSAMGRRLERQYAAKDCAAWLARRGGVGAAWRRVRVSQWVSFRTR